MKTIFLLACFCALAGPKLRALARPLPGAWITNTGRTRSMGDAFPPGAKARLLPYRPGMVVTWWVGLFADDNHEHFVAHRITNQGIAANGRRWFETKGDGNMFSDPLRWSEDELVGILDLPRRVPR